MLESVDELDEISKSKHFFKLEPNQQMKLDSYPIATKQPPVPLPCIEGRYCSNCCGLQKKKKKQNDK